MGKIIDITKYGNDKQGARRSMFKPSVRFGLTAIGFVTIIIVCLLAMIYLMQANKTATYGFEIEKYDKMITDLQEEQDKLELEAARLRSTTKIKEEVEKMNMQEVDTTKISYYDMKKALAMEEKQTE